MELTTETKTSSLNAYVQTHQNSNTNKTENNTPKTMDDLEKKYGDKFEDYLQKFNELTKDDNTITKEEGYELKYKESVALKEITDIKNANGGNFVDEEVILGLNPSLPPELAEQQNDLMKKIAQNPDDASYVWMLFEIPKQYNQYMNGEEPTSIFQVDGNGKFMSELKSTNKKFDAQEFVNKMLEVFTNELSNAKSNDQKEIYQRLVDGYKDMKEQLENPPYKETVVYG
ncbi:MAG: hypothetical protein C0626_10090 [Arcobacter sp.]|uniref:hypothetical protein n=1 Tax=uncultured Arcobacter sp. TaxID=165434 RepID=UPI000CA9A649|nr:hypothetical protein [uncultured Arcobacter sp.]PLY09332.1 MAG: hypothetical protein C0626_10090 [Arcobacter sp.]